jgi:hypothetical protein
VTGRNFRSIANGYSKKFVKHYSVEAGKHQTTELTLSYRNTKIHRIVPGFVRFYWLFDIIGALLWADLT